MDCTIFYLSFGVLPSISWVGKSAVTGWMFITSFDYRTVSKVLEGGMELFWTLILTQLRTFYDVGMDQNHPYIPAILRTEGWVPWPMDPWTHGLVVQYDPSNLSWLPSAAAGEAFCQYAGSRAHHLLFMHGSMQPSGPVPCHRDMRVDAFVLMK